MNLPKKKQKQDNPKRMGIIDTVHRLFKAFWGYQYDCIEHQE